MRKKSNHLLLFICIAQTISIVWPFDQAIFALWPNLTTWTDI
jgi:hypothetical protein